MTGLLFPCPLLGETVQRGPVAIFMPIVRCTCGLRLLVPCKRPWLHLRPRPAAFTEPCQPAHLQHTERPPGKSSRAGVCAKMLTRRGACRPSRYRRHRSRGGHDWKQCKKTRPSRWGRLPSTRRGRGGGRRVGWPRRQEGRANARPQHPRAPALSRAFAASRVAPPLSCPVPLLTKTSCAGNTRCTAPRWPG